jgi:hypothetical protein
MGIPVACFEFTLLPAELFFESENTIGFFFLWYEGNICII